MDYSEEEQNYRQHILQSRKSEITVLNDVGYHPVRSNVAYAGNANGEIAVWDLNECYTNAFWKENKAKERILPRCIFQADQNAIHRLLSTPNWLISAGEEFIRFWKWEDILSIGEIKENHAAEYNPFLSPTEQAVIRKATALNASRSYTHPQAVGLKHSLSPRVSTLDLSLSPDNKTLFAAGFDGFVRGFDFETGAVVFSVQHSNNQEALSCRASASLVYTGGQGSNSVKGWDLRSPNAPSIVLAPTASTSSGANIKSQEVLNSSSLHAGKERQITERAHTLGVSSIDVTDDGLWVAAASKSGYAALYHSLTGSIVAGLPHGVPLTRTKFHEGSIFTAGSSNSVIEWSFTGEILNEVATSIPSVRGFGIGTHGFAVSGASQNIDILAADFSKRYYSISFSTS